jgi:D-aminopeptidase
MDKKLYLVSDLSSVSGLLWGGCGLPAWHGVPALQDDQLRHQMSLVVNEAVDVAVQCGVDEILVHEACPLDLEILHPATRIIRGSKSLYLDHTFSGLCFLGQGLTASIPFPDNYPKNLRNIQLNGTEVDELTIMALYAATLNVPVILAHGEESSFQHLKKYVPALMVSSIIDSVLRENLDSLDALPKPVVQGPIEMEYIFDSPVFADMHCRLPGVRRISDLATAVSAKNMQEAFASYCAVGLVAAVDWVRRDS